MCHFMILQIDNAILFCDIGGMKMVIQSLNHSSADMRSISSSLLATALQKYGSFFLSPKQLSNPI